MTTTRQAREIHVIIKRVKYIHSNIAAHTAKSTMSLSPSPPPKPAKKKTFMFKRANLGNTSNSTSDELSFFSRNRENYTGAVEPREEKKPGVVKKNTRSCDSGVSSPPKRAKRQGTEDDDDDSGDEIISTQKRHANANARERCDFSAICGGGGLL